MARHCNSLALRAMLAAVVGATLAAAPAVKGIAAPSRADREIEASLRGHIGVLAGDEMDGREPGTEGESKTLRYLGREWYEIGLVSGTNDPSAEWFVPVRLVARQPAVSTALFTYGKRNLFYPAGGVLVLTSAKRSLVRSAPLLFVGTGDAAAYSRAELAGQVAVLLNGGVSDSARQTRLLEQGAAAVLTILDGDRTIEEVSALRDRSGYALADDALGGDLEAFVTREAMDALLRPTGRTVASLASMAAASGFRPLGLGLDASLEATTRETTIRTHNLIGKLPGRIPDSGAVLFVAHWDHFGECGDPDAEDRICNGAVDNASGVAALTEIARRLARGRPLDRDVYFLATTAEELGLLGAQAFANNPPIPLDRIVAAFKIDSIAIAPRGTPFGIVGKGMTPLDADIAKVAKENGFRVVPGEGANAYVRRQDGWALLQHDIPTVMVTTSYGDIALMERFFETDYHRPSDDLTRPLELGGAVEDVKLLTELGRWFGDTRKVPAPPGSSAPAGK